MYWAGCTARYVVPEISSSMTGLLRRAGVEYTVLDEEVCCGYPLLLLGDFSSFASTASKALNLIRGTGVGTVVTGCPGCYRCFTEFYPRFLGDLPLRVLHSTQLVKELVDSGRLRVGREVSMRVTYHDPCDLGRHMGVYDLPRQLISSIPGVRLIEMGRSRDAARCCGSGGVLRILIPQLSSQIASTRVKDDVAPLDVDAIVTACPTCVKGLRDGASIAEVAYGVKHVEVLDVVQLVSMAAGV